MQKYTKKVVLIHWIHAILISIALIGGFLNLPDLPKEASNLESFKMHMIIGFIIFIMLIVRVVFIIKEPKLERLNMSPIKERFVKQVHRLIYIFIAFTAMSGMAMAKSANLGKVLIFGEDIKVYSPIELTFELAEVHEVSAYILLGLIIVHILGVIIYILQGNRGALKRVWF